jgi:hypothetical protein
MSNAENISVGCWTVGDLGERWHTRIARELEDMGGVFDDIDVNISTLQRINTSTSVDRVLILICLDDPIEPVWPISVPSHIIQVQPVGLATLASDNT